MEPTEPSFDAPIAATPKAAINPSALVAGIEMLKGNRWSIFGGIALVVASVAGTGIFMTPDKTVCVPAPEPAPVAAVAPAPVVVEPPPVVEAPAAVPSGVKSYEARAPAPVAKRVTAAPKAVVPPSPAPATLDVVQPKALDSSGTWDDAEAKLDAMLGATK